MKVTLIKKPTEEDLIFCKHCLWITDTKRKKQTPKNRISSELLAKILDARHSPIRVLQFGFLIEDIPSNISTHLARHVHAQPFIGSLRNDRQDEMDGDAARRDTPVDMILYCNAEELMTIANKRLCFRAAQKTREVVEMMCNAAEEALPELDGLLVPMCEYRGRECHELDGCGWNEHARY